MDSFTLYTWNEAVALVTSVAFGTGAYIAFVKQRQIKKVNLTFILTVIGINTFFTYVASEILKVTSWGVYRNIVLPIVAFSGQYLMDWFDKKYLKIFDAGFEKVTGKKLENDGTDENNYNEERDSD